MEIDGVLATGRVIRWYLPELLGAEATEVDAALATILNDAEAAPDVVADRLRTELERYAETAAFLSVVVSDEPAFRPPQVQPGVLKGYKALAGDSLPILANRYRCPDDDYDWWRPSVGVPIPVCPTHGKHLRRG